MTTKVSTECPMDENKHSGTVFIGQRIGAHGPGEAYMHLSTQVRCDARYGVDLHRTVSGQATRINPELPDEGTYPTSQDSLRLPPRTSKYNAAAGLVYL